jgi:hypothetical protein
LAGFSSAQRRLAFAMAGPNAVLVALQANQAGTHAGQPGGLGNAMDGAARAELLLFARHNKPKEFRDPCSVGPDQPNAHDLMTKFIMKLMNRLIASMYYLKELENLALDWLADQFTGRAADQWTLVIREASRTATTSGIGPNSVLYRALRDMLAAYPAHGVKAAIMRRKVVDLVWAPNKTTVEIHSAVMEYYEAYDRAVAQTQGLADVTMIVPAQDWATRFTELQTIFPPWVLALCTNFPDRFTNMSTCWVAIIAEASRQAAGRKMGSGGRVLQLAAADTMTAGELEGISAGLYEYPPEFDLDTSASIFALRGVQGCYRCGGPHLRRDCDKKPSAAELQGLPMNHWAKFPEAQSGITGARSQGFSRPFQTSRVGAPAAASPPVVAQVASLTDRLDRYEALLQSALARMSAAPAVTAGALLPPATFTSNALAQITAPVPSASVPTPLMLGGVQPEGYVYVGSNQGLAVWGREDIVATAAAAAAMEDGQEGNGPGM